MAAITLDVAAASIGGNSFLTDLEGCTFTLETDTVDNHSIVSPGVSKQVQKIKGTFDFPMFSTSTIPDRISDLNLSVATLGGTSLLTFGLESLKLSVGYVRQQRPNAGSPFHYPQNTIIEISGSARVATPDTGITPFLGDAASTTHSDRVKSLSFTLNGVAITLPVVITGAGVPFERGGLQMCDISLGPRVPASGAYPSAPTGTTTLLEKALNAYRTPLAISATTKATTGLVISGSNFIFDPWELEITDGGLVVPKYKFVNVGAFTVVPL